MKGRTTIGITGSIASGKSVVRKMLEHLGAYGIDADTLSHRVMAFGAPGYEPVVSLFGTWILDTDKQINRNKLAHIVFNYPEMMSQLEEIIHPLVHTTVVKLMKQTKTPVIVIEAVKLLQSDLKTECDQIWSVVIPQDVQLTRLTEKRGMDIHTALARIDAQTSLMDEFEKTNRIIHNAGSFEGTWKQVQSAWSELFPEEKKIAVRKPKEVEPEPIGKQVIERGGPAQAQQIAEFLTTMNPSQFKYSRTDIMEAFGEKAYLLLKIDGKIHGIAGWQVENLVTRIDDLFIASPLNIKEGAQRLIRAVEEASKPLLSEAALLYLFDDLAEKKAFWKELGYEYCLPGNLRVRAWRDAALGRKPERTKMFFKQLRQDLILQPM